MVSGDPAELTAYQTVASTFGQKHPEYTVTVLHVPGTSAYLQRLNADLTAGTPADVVLLNYRRMTRYAAQGALLSLSERIQASTQIAPEDFYSQVYEAFNWQGQQWCIPQNISSLVVYYNRDLFQAAGLAEPSAGWTLENFVQTAQQLTLDADGDGVIDQYGLGVEPAFIRLTPFVWQRRGEVVTADLNQLALNMLPTTQAFQWFVDLRQAYSVVPTAEEEEAEESESRFFNGRTAMYLDSRRIVPALREAAQFDWDVAPLPVGQQPANILHADGYCLPSGAANPEGAWAFIEFANSADGQSIIAATGRTVPSNRAVAESPVFLNPAVKPLHSQVWLDTIHVMRALPLIPNWADIEEIADAEIKRAFYGQATVPEAAAAAISRAEEYLLATPIP
jgi:multiple sugar transport system substrate-binding protein